MSSAILNEKIVIEQDISMQLSPNSKRIIIQKKNRRITAPISVLRTAMENKSLLDEGETLSIDSSWQINVEDWAGLDYVCFHKLDDDMIRIRYVHNLL